MIQFNVIISHSYWSPLSYAVYDVIHDYRFFHGDPPSKTLFTRVNVADVFSGEFYVFAMRFYTTLTELINRLHNPEVLDSMLEHLNKQHVARPGVKQEHFHVRYTHANLKLP